MSDLLSPELLSRLERLSLQTRQRLVGALAGEHRSRRFGSSLDFADYREYHPGDDLRRLDLFAAARLDRLLVRLFEAEDEVTVRLLVDTSASMGGVKLRRALECSAAIGFLALTARDVVSVHTVDGDGASGRRFAGQRSRPALFEHLASLTAAGDTPFATAAMRLLSRPGPAGLTVVVSDLLTPEWEQGLRRLPARGGDLLVVHVIDPADVRPDLHGDLELVDRETGQRLEVSISSAVSDDFARAAEAWIDRVARTVRSVGGAYVQLLTDEPVEQMLVGVWQREGALR